jgi:hypothetical protein
MEYKEVLSNTKGIPVEKTTLLHEWGERKGEKWFPQKGAYMFHNGISLSQAMKTMKLT